MLLCQFLYRRIKNSLITLFDAIWGRTDLTLLEDSFETSSVHGFNSHHLHHVCSRCFPVAIRLVFQMRLNYRFCFIGVVFYAQVSLLSFGHYLLPLLKFSKPSIGRFNSVRIAAGTAGNYTHV